LADEGEILDLYSNWEALQFKTYVFDDEHPNVPRHQHAVNKLVARKKASCCNNDVI
jgi:tellurite methyltransferase